MTTQEKVRELARDAAELAARADSPSAHPVYQHEKVLRAWRLLTEAFLELEWDLGASVDLAAELDLIERRR